MITRMMVVALAMVGLIATVYGQPVAIFKDDFEDGINEEVLNGTKWVVSGLNFGSPVSNALIYVDGSTDLSNVNNSGQNAPFSGNVSARSNAEPGEAIAQFASRSAFGLNLTGLIRIGAGSSSGTNNWPTMGLRTNNGFIGAIAPCCSDVPQGLWDIHHFTDAENGSEQESFAPGSTYGELHSIEISIDPFGTSIVTVTELQADVSISSFGNAPPGTIVEDIWLRGNGGVFFDDIVLTPEPVSLALFGLGGLVLLRRRR